MDGDSDLERLKKEVESPLKYSPFGIGWIAH